MATTCRLFTICSMDASSKCPLTRSGCLLYKDSRKISTCNENGKRYALNNTNYTIANYRVDGGVMKGAIDKCDYLFLCYGQKDTKAILIELKGKDNDHACKQIYETLITYKKDLQSMQNLGIYARIVNTKTAPNDFLKTYYCKLVKLLQRMNNSSDIRVVFKGVKCSESITSL